MIFASLDEFLNSPTWSHIKGAPIVSTSCPGDPLHVGHVRCLLESGELARYLHGHFVVIVNSDEFLIRKKGKAFMPHAERMEIIHAIKGVDYVIGWEDGTQTVVAALEKLKPTYFTKGGDRSEPSKLPEWDICQQIGCTVLFGIGGKEKIQSSSSLISAAKEE